MEEIYPLLQEVVDSGGEFRLHPRGTSMLPLLREGRDSVLLVKPRELKPLGVYLYRRANGQFVMHRLMHLEDGAPVFCGDNQLALERGVPADAVIAEMASYYRGDRHISLTSLRYRIYVAVHCCMPWRRLYFLPRRAIGFLKRKFKK
jgi:hypothetical protein